LTFARSAGTVTLMNEKNNPGADGCAPLTRESFDRLVSRCFQVRYLAFLPRDARGVSGQRWPLLLFLHGMGERGDDLSLVKKHGPPKLVGSDPRFPFILIAPQCPLGEWWSNESLLALLDEVCEKYPVDRSRVYLTGLSMGAFGGWSLALACPERFAAVALVCGGGNPFPPFGFEAKRAEALKTLPFWAFHGAKDPVVPASESVRMAQVLERFGCSVRLTIYPEAEHDSWTQTYANPALYEWFLQQRRSG
jgi:predicted peptidase